MYETFQQHKKIIDEAKRRYDSDIKPYLRTNPSKAQDSIGETLMLTGFNLDGQIADPGLEHRVIILESKLASLSSFCYSPLHMPDKVKEVEKAFDEVNNYIKRKQASGKSKK